MKAIVSHAATLLALATSLALFTPIATLAADEFIWGITPCEVYEYNTDKARLDFVGVGSIYLSQNASAGTWCGVRYSSPGVNDKVTFSSVRFEFINMVDNYSGTCSFEGTDQESGRAVTGSLSYTSGTDIKDFVLTTWTSGAGSSGIPRRRYLPLRSTVGKGFRDKYVPLIDLKDLLSF